MNTKKLNIYIRKELKKIGKDMRREKARCARLYPDWRDDEFNMLDNLFIWGYNTNPKITPSFYSWDEAYIYYNRITNKYYMTIDISFYGGEYNAELARKDDERLSQIKEAFRDFLIEKDLPLRAQIFPFQELELEADTLSELYVKFCMMYAGYDLYNKMD
jgi:hypothetical protein